MGIRTLFYGFCGGISILFVFYLFSKSFDGFRDDEFNSTLSTREDVYDFLSEESTYGIGRREFGAFISVGRGEFSVGLNVLCVDDVYEEK